MVPIDRVCSTTSASRAATVDWDIVIIGAGPAGALAAVQSATLGCKVLLVDRAIFPRRKVCGCCLNGAAIDVLERSGLGRLVQECHAIELNRLKITAGKNTATVALQHGVSLSRERLDCALIQAAIDRQVDFIDGALAQLEHTSLQRQIVRLKGRSTQVHVSARLVIAAGGLGSRIFADSRQETRQVKKRSRVGAGAVLENVSTAFEPGTIFMNCHCTGYVGLVRLEDGRLDVAAALDAHAIKQFGGPAELVSEILRCSALPTPAGLTAAQWQGTPLLTQRRTQVAQEGCLYIGDAAGYVEPFTGEGMAWALASGNAAASLAVAAIRAGEISSAVQAWTDLYHEMIVKRSRVCKLLSRGLRYPAATRACLPLLSVFPWAARPIVSALNAPLRGGWHVTR